MKFYSDLCVADTAVAIFKDMVYDGISSGWEPADVVGISQVKKYLEPYNIKYVWKGLWRADDPEKRSCSPKFSIGQHVYCSGPMNTIDHCVVEEIVIRQDVIAYRLNDGTTRAQENLYDGPECVIEDKMKQVKAEIEKLEKELETLRKDRDEAIRYRYGKEG